MVNSFSKFLVEEEQTIYFTFGRMNPPTMGHEKLLDKLSSQAGSKFPYRVYLSQTKDADKNPLEYADKIKIARKMFPKHGRKIMLNKKVKTVFDIMNILYNENYANIAMVVGSDRVQEFEVLLNKYNGKKGRHGFYNFRKISVISAGQRDPDAEGVEGMSASKQRDNAKNNDFTTFSQGLPRAVSNSDAKKIFNAVRKGMGLKEQKEFKNHVQLEPVSDLRESYIDGKLFREGDKVIMKETGEIVTVKRLGSNYVIVEGSSNQQYRKWIDAVEPLEEPKVYEEVKVDRFEDVYYKGLSKSTSAKRKAHFNKNTPKPDDQKSAYKPAPGDAQAKTKPSKHTLKFKQMFGEDQMADLAKKRIDREKKADQIKHDRMMDRARTNDTRKKNRETK